MKMRKALSLILVVLLLLECFPIVALAGADAMQCPQGCPRWHVEIWSGGTYDTDSPDIWNHIYGYNVVDNYRESITEPKCTEDGSITRHCSYCGYTESTPIKALGHDYKEISCTQPTCTEAGYRTLQCQRHTTCSLPYGMGISISGCADTIREEIPALGHEFVAGDIISKATCTSAALYEKKCERCELVDGTVSAGEPLGHDFAAGEIISEATCTSAALYEEKCERCGLVDRTIEGEPLGHDFEETGTVLVPASCLWRERVETQCSLCGEKGDKEVDGLGDHIWVQVSYIPQKCLVDGELAQRCMICQRIDKQTLPKYGNHQLATKVISPTLIVRFCVRDECTYQEFISLEANGKIKTDIRNDVIEASDDDTVHSGGDIASTDGDIVPLGDVIVPLGDVIVPTGGGIVPLGGFVLAPALPAALDVQTAFFAMGSLSHSVGELPDDILDNPLEAADLLSRTEFITILWMLEDAPSAEYATSFKDVSDQQYTEAISWAQSIGIVNGYSIEQFGFTDNITREQIAAFLYRFAKAEKPTSGITLPFDDADEISDWAKDALVWCYENGIVLGKGDGRIDPKGLATCAEAATMIQRFYNLTDHIG